MTLKVPSPTPLQTTKRTRRIKLDGHTFNAVSIAIISAAALQFSPAFAQMTAPATKPAAPAAADAAPAAVSPDSAKAMEAFARADKNKDGKLSKAEADSIPGLTQRFADVDADKDGSISQNEFMDAMKK